VALIENLTSARHTQWSRKVLEWRTSPADSRYETHTTASVSVVTSAGGAVPSTETSFAAIRSIILAHAAQIRAAGSCALPPATGQPFHGEGFQTPEGKTGA